MGDWGSGWKGKAFQNESPGLSADSKGGKLFLKIGQGSGARGGAGEGPPSYQLRSARRDNPKGPEKKQANCMCFSKARKKTQIRMQN